MNIPNRADQEAAALAQVTHVLTERYHQPTLPPELTWEALSMAYSRCTPAQPRVRRVRFSPRLVLVAAVSILALGVGGATMTAGGLSTLLDERPAQSSADTGLLAAYHANLFTAVGQTHTQNGVTVTLESAYADANRVALSLVVTASPPGLTGGDWSFGAQPELVTAAGQTLLGERNESDLHRPPEATGQNGRVATIISFDAGGLPSDQSRLTLHALLAYACLNADHNPCPATAPTVVAPLRYAFDFGVPFAGGRTLMLAVATTHNGVTVTLDKVVLTRSQTRFYLHGLPGGIIAGEGILPGVAYTGQVRLPDGRMVQLPDGSPVRAPVTIPTFDWVHYVTGQRYRSEDKTLVIAFDQALEATPGQWQLAIQPVSPSSVAPPPDLTGPWLLRFALA